MPYRCLVGVLATILLCICGLFAIVSVLLPDEMVLILMCEAVAYTVTSKTVLPFELALNKCRNPSKKMSFLAN